MSCVNLNICAWISHIFIPSIQEDEERRKHTHFRFFLIFKSKEKINTMSFKTEHIFHINYMYATATNYISQTEAIT